eukprot:1143066-Pelagomonas_calceolata.AAC.2
MYRSSWEKHIWSQLAYSVPAGVGHRICQGRQEFSGEQEVCHMSFLKGTLGVKRATPNWGVLRECGHVPLRFYWFMSAVKMCNGLLSYNCETLRKVLNADLHLHSQAPSCWTAQILDGFPGLRHCDSFVTVMKQGTGCAHGEMLREWTPEKQVANCQHTKHSFKVALPLNTMCANPSGCRGTCIWIVSTCHA